MRVLITGATGFIGSHLAEMLSNSDYEVRVLVRRSSRTDALSRSGVEIVYGDVRDPESLHGAVKGVDTVFHSAALVGEWGVPADYYEVNVNGMKNMISAAATAGVSRFVDVSSVAVHGNEGHDKSNEDAPMKRTGVLYSASKYEAEKLLWEAHRKKQILATAIRPVMVWGPGDNAFLPKLIQTLKKRMFAYIGDGRNIIGLAHVRNVCDVILSAAENPEAAGRAFIVHDDCKNTVRDVVETLCAELNLPKPVMSMPYGVARVIGGVSEWAGHLINSKSAPMLTKMSVEIMGNPLSFDITKAKSVLGYIPKHVFPDDLPEFLEWFKREYSWTGA